MIVAITQPNPVNELGLISPDLPEFDIERSGGDVYIPTRFDPGNPTIYTGGGSGNYPVYPILPVNNNPTEPIQTVVTTSDPQPSTTTDQPASNETPQQAEAESTVTIDSNTLLIGGGIAAALVLILIVK